MKYFCFISIFLIANCIVDDPLQIEFSNFKKTYNKSYIDANEEKKRFDIFKKNFEKYGYLNPFSDLPDRDQAIIILTEKGAFPDSFSYESDLGAAKDQKDCAFCFVFSYLAQIEAQYYIKYGKSYSFSEQELLDCSGNDLTCSGNNFPSIQGFMATRKYLTLNDKYDSYTGKKDSSRCSKMSEEETKYTSTIKLSIGEMKSYPLGKSKNKVKCMKSLLIKNGPIGTVIHASLLDNYKSGIIDSDINCNKNLDDYHAVTIVGYAKDHYDQDYWIVRNSYGAGWGENGYFKVLAGQDICGIESMVYNFNITWDSWCGAGCDQCDYESGELICKSCITGYYYASDKKCYKCIEGCNSCENHYSCTTCGDGYYLYSSYCYKCMSGCKKCTDAIGCQEWYIGNSLSTNNYLDDEIEENCICNAKYLYSTISLILLNLLF